MINELISLVPNEKSLVWFSKNKKNILLLGARNEKLDHLNQVF